MGNEGPHEGGPPFLQGTRDIRFSSEEKGTILKMYLVGAIMSSPKLRKKIGNEFFEGMIAPYRKVLEEKKDR
jgi:hypothetical protein